jgi:putative cell wall-binding protein
MTSTNGVMMRAVASRASTIAAALVAGTVAVALATPAAYAFSVSASATASGGAAVLLAAGGPAQPISGLTISFTDSAVAHVWSSGDTLTVQLWDGTTGAALSNTSVDAFEGAAFSAFPTVATSNVDVTYYGVALAKSAGSSVNDEVVLTFTRDAPEDTHASQFSFSGLKINLGTRIPAGHHLQLRVHASSGTPFAGGTATAFIPVGVVPATSTTVSSVATGAPSAGAVAIGTLAIRDVTGGAVNAADEIDLTLTGGFFSVPGTASGSIPASPAPTIITVSSLSDTVKVTATKTSVVGDTLTLAGARITLPSSPREAYIIVTDHTTSTVLGAVGVATAVGQERVGGSDRYFTASRLFDLAFTSATSVVLTSGANYPDALSAIHLAGQLSTGVLTTDPAALPSATRTELLTHPFSTVYIVGGPSAVSANVAAQIASLHVANNPSSPLIMVVRIAGSDRYATNNRADTFSASGVGAFAVIATGENFADALAVGPAVYKTGEPLILTPSASLSTSAKATIAALHITHVVIVGGTSAVSAQVETQLAAVGVTVDYRIAGAERTATAAQIAAWESDGLVGHDIYPPLASLAFSGSGVIYVARGDGFADALAAAPVAGDQQSVIVLTSNPTTVGPGVPAYFAGRSTATSTIRAVGQVNAMSATTVNLAAASLTQPLVLP